MVQIPQTYPLVQEQAIATFDFVDIANGLGFETFWLVAGRDSVSTKFILTNLNLTSEDISIDTSTATEATFTFNTSVFNLPRTVKGTALPEIILQALVGGGVSHSFSVKLQVVHVGGSTTDISAEITSATIALPTATNRTFLIEVPLTETRIKRGEKIRALVKITEDDGTTISLRINGSESNINIPFRNDL